jgi:hypothetical protein
MSFIFFIAAVPKDSQRFQQRCASTFYFYAVRCTLQQAMQQHGSFAILLFFLIDKVVKHSYKMKCWACKTVAAAASSFII